MRINHSMKNITMGVITQLIITLLGFVSRRVFIDSLGTEYLGVNGVLTNVLTAMVLLEGGIGVSIVYNLYKPLAENNQRLVTALIRLYKKAYLFLAGLIFLVCLILFPFLDTLVKSETEIPYLNLVYWIFVAKCLASYLIADKTALINADQKGYILAKYNLFFQVLSILIKIVILVTTKNYVLFLAIELALYVIQNSYSVYLVKKMYPYLNMKERCEIDPEVKANIITNVKAMFIQNIGYYAINGTDNLVITGFINVITVGFYSNYSMIISQLTNILTPIINGIGNSVGNLIATESKEKAYSIYQITQLITFWVYSVCTIALFNVLEPFIEWWLGDGFLLDRLTFIVLLLNFYLMGVHQTLKTFKSKAGLFAQDKYAYLIEGILNLVLSIILVQKFGLAGVFLGTTISFLLVSFWNQPRILFQQYFKQSVFYYYLDYGQKLVLMIVVGYLVKILCEIITIDLLFLSIIIKGCITVLVPSCIYCVVFYRTEAFQYIWNVFGKQFILSKFKILKTFG